MLKVASQIIWDVSRVSDRDETRLELTSLIRFRDHWYCAFREGLSHWNHPSGRGRIIRSADGVHWDTVLLMTWDCGDVREPKLSITPEGRLMINTSIYYVSREPRYIVDGKVADGDAPPEANQGEGRYFQLDWLGTTLNMPNSDREDLATQQSMTWHSADGENWESAFACPTGLNTWRWDTTWYNGMAYSVGQWGKDLTGTLYRSRDGKNWRVHKADFCPGGKSNEGGIAFGPDGTGYCLLRHGADKVQLGIGRAPYYVDWEWKTLEIDWAGDGNFLPARDVLRVSLGGPQLKTLQDGRIIAAGRALGPGQDDGRIALFLVDPMQARLVRFAEIDGTSYPGVVEHEGELWVSSARTNVQEILLARLPLPSQS